MNNIVLDPWKMNKKKQEKGETVKQPNPGGLLPGSKTLPKKVKPRTSSNKSLSDVDIIIRRENLA